MQIFLGFAGRMIRISVGVLFIYLAFTGVANSGEEAGFRLHVDFGVFDPRGYGMAIDTGADTFGIDLDGGGGAGVRGEYRLGRRVGVEVGVFVGSSIDINLWYLDGDAATSVGFETFVPITVGMDLHLTPDARVDLYLSPQLALVRYGDVEVGVFPGYTGTRVSVDSDVGLGASLGLDIPLGEMKRWSIQMTLRHIDTTMEGHSGSTRIEADFDPTIFSIGFGYRFR